MLREHTPRSRIRVYPASETALLTALGPSYCRSGMRSSASMTLYMGLEQALRDEVPGFEELVVV